MPALDTSGVMIMAGSWKVKCFMSSGRGSGNANEEFSTMADAVAFVESWMGPGWVGQITDPSGRRAELERGKPPRFPTKPDT